MTPGEENSVMDSTCPAHQDPDPDPAPDACEATQHPECGAGECGEFPACLPDALADVQVWAQQQAAAGGGDWACDEPVHLGAQHTDDAGALCSFDLACTVMLDPEGGVMGLAECSYEPETCGRIDCRFAI